MVNMAQEGVHHLKDNNDNVQASWANRLFHPTDACIQHKQNMFSSRAGGEPVCNWYQSFTFGKCEICVRSISIILGSNICAQISHLSHF